MYGSVEAGGTKFRCAVGTGPDDLGDELRLDATGPDETLDRVVGFFRGHASQLLAVGLGSFGPVDLNPRSSTYGFITATPKPGWSHTDIAGRLRSALGVPVGFDTDVAASALGEGRWGAARGLGDFVYVTVGTGIGAAIVSGGRLVHGLVHPEVGHMRVPRHPEDDFAGVCAFHGDCFEGLASGVAIQRRWGAAGAALAPGHPAWELEAYYLACGLSNLVLTVSPERVVVGGGVLEQQHLLPRVRRHFRELLNGYVAAPEVDAGLERFLVAPGLGPRSGILGGLVLAMQAHAAARGAGRGS